MPRRNLRRLPLSQTQLRAVAVRPTRLRDDLFEIAEHLLENRRVTPSVLSSAALCTVETNRAGERTLRVRLPSLRK